MVGRRLLAALLSASGLALLYGLSDSLLIVRCSGNCAISSFPPFVVLLAPGLLLAMPWRRCVLRDCSGLLKYEGKYHPPGGNLFLLNSSAVLRAVVYVVLVGLIASGELEQGCLCKLFWVAGHSYQRCRDAVFFVPQGGLSGAQLVQDDVFTSLVFASHGWEVRFSAGWVEIQDGQLPWERLPVLSDGSWLVTCVTLVVLVPFSHIRVWLVVIGHGGPLAVGCVGCCWQCW